MLFLSSKEYITTPISNNPIPKKVSKGLLITVNTRTAALNDKKRICNTGLNGLRKEPGVRDLINRLVATVSYDISCKMKPEYNNTFSKEPVRVSIMLITTCAQMAVTGMPCLFVRDSRCHRLYSLAIAHVTRGPTHR